MVFTMRELIEKIELLEKRIEELEDNQYPEVMNKSKAMEFLFGKLKSGKPYRNHRVWNYWKSKGWLFGRVQGKREIYFKKTLKRAIELAESSTLDYENQREA